MNKLHRQIHQACQVYKTSGYRVWTNGRKVFAQRKAKEPPDTFTIAYVAKHGKIYKSLSRRKGSAPTWQEMDGQLYVTCPHCAKVNNISDFYIEDGRTRSCMRCCRCGRENILYVLIGYEERGTSCLKTSQSALARS